MNERTAAAVAMVGIPYDAGSSFLRGPAQAPPRIRQTLFSGAANLWTEGGHDLGKDERWIDVGDLELDTKTAALPQIEAGIDALLDAGLHLLSLGGDHSITYPIIRAHARRYPRLNILQIDAHPDLYDELDGNRLSHATPFARIMEAYPALRLVQVGIRTMNAHQRAQAERFGVEVVAMRDWEKTGLPRFEGPLYLSLDLDALDPAFAPGVSHHEPGGLSARELLTIIQEVDGSLVGADIVEYNPVRDPIDMTAMLAAKCAKELLGRLLPVPA